MDEWQEHPLIEESPHRSHLQFVAGYVGHTTNTWKKLLWSEEINNKHLAYIPNAMCGVKHMVWWLCHAVGMFYIGAGKTG